MKSVNFSINKETDDIEYICPHCGDVETMELYEFCESHCINYDCFDPHEDLDLEVECFNCGQFFELLKVKEAADDTKI